jgi:CO/xanthine dehydrogenase FAD-binding subunit
MDGFRPYHYLKPETLQEASDALLKYKDSIIIGGGTEIYELAGRGLLSGISALIDLTKLRLNEVKIEDRCLSIGTSTTLSQLENERILHQDGRFGCLLDALHEIRPIQVKNLATIGGSICSCIPFFDLPIALASLNAMVNIYGTGKVKSANIASFQKDFLQPDLQQGEFVERVTIQLNKSVSAFSKLALTGDDWAMVNCACSLSIKSGKIVEARIVFGALLNRLFVAERVASFITGREADSELFKMVTEVLDNELPEPISDHRASSKYRRRIANLLLLETLKKAISRSQGEGA